MFLPGSTTADYWLLDSCRFQDILVAKGYNNGEPITREFFDEHISGGHNILLGKFLWPDWSQEDRDRFADEKEALFREYSGILLTAIVSQLQDGEEVFSLNMSWTD